MKRSAWIFLSVFSMMIAPLAAASGAPGGRSLQFLAQPASAEKGATISSSDYSATGAPILVQVLDASGALQTSSRDWIVMSIAPDSPQADPSARLTGTTRVRAVSGVATFGDLSITRHGIYKLLAETTGAAPATSDAFTVWDAVEVCASPGQSCKENVGQLRRDDMTSSIAGASNGNAVIAMSIGLDSIDCGDTGNHAPTTITFLAENLGGEKYETTTISKSFDQRQANNGASFYEVCFESDTAFPRKGDGALVTLGLLPDCGPMAGPPCVHSRTKEKGGNVVIVSRLGDGDPKRF